MKGLTILEAYERAQEEKGIARSNRPGGNFGIAIEKDEWATIYQIRDRQADKFYDALRVKLGAEKSVCSLCGLPNHQTLAERTTFHSKRLKLVHPWKSKQPTGEEINW